MQIKLRKVLAVLSVLAMLCTVLPMGVFAASNDGFVTNGDFETGDLTGWKSGYSGQVVSTVAHSGTYSHKTTNTASKYQGMMQQNPVKVAANSDYTVTFWYYYEGSNATGSGASFYLYAQTTDNKTNIKSITCYPNAANTWYQATHTFNTGNNTEIALVWSNRMASDGGTYYFDDVVMTGPAPSDEPVVNPVPESFGRIENGGFEEATGGLTLKYGSRTTEAAYSGNYSLKGTSQTKYGVYAYTTFASVPNSDYTFSFKIKLAGDATSASTNQRLYIKASDESTVLKQLNITDATTDWKSYSVTVNSGENETVYFSFAQGIDNGGTCYIDDIIVEGPAPSEGGDEPELPPVATEPSNDGYIVNGTFETGVLDPWTVNKGGKVAYVDGSYVLQGTATAKYDAHVQQSVTVEANTDYLITFKAKLAQSGGQIRFVVNGNGTRLNNDAYYFTSTTDWQTFQIQVNSGDNTTLDLLPTQGVNNGGDIYYDDITMKKIETDAGYQGSYPETVTSGADIRYMTYNVLVGQDTENGGYSWGQAIGDRPAKAFAMINYYKPDVIAFEEFSGEWYDAFTTQMTDYVLCEMQSKDSQNGGKLYTCLAYNKNTINKIETKLFRNTVSRWGTQGMRYVNVAVLEVKATGERFIAAALHPDAGELVGTEDLNNDGVAGEGSGYWRQFQLQEAGEYLAALSDEYQLPLIVGGDFNSGLDGTYNDYTSWYNFTDCGFTDATNGRYIDHIMYNGMATHLYETTVADAAVLPASDHKPVFADIQFLDEFATPIKNAKDYIKTQGRTTLKDGAMWLDFSASGIEFTADCEGKVALNLTVNSIKNTDATYGGIYFTVIVDGDTKERAECRITSTGNVELVLAENLPAGTHTFEVYRQTEHRGAEVGISSIVMNGSFNDKPANNRLYIEFIGDSISTGYGALGQAGADQADSPLWQDATVAYPYLTAQALNADFSDVCYSGLGCKYGYSGSLSMQTVYTAQRYQYDQNTQYNFNTRQPDVVVIALGTNDIANQDDVALRQAGYQEMLDLVRAKNPNSKIVWIYGMMKDDDNAMIAQLMEDNGGAAAGLFSLELVTNTAGAGWHPSKDGQAKFAEDLVAFMNSDVLVKYVDDVIYDDFDTDVDTLINSGTSRSEMGSGKLGVAFRFTLNASGITTVNTTEAVLTDSNIKVFNDGKEYKLLAMGAMVANTPNHSGLKINWDSENKVATAYNGSKRVLNVNAQYLCELEDDYAAFAVRIINIPEANQATLLYARPYYVFEYIDDNGDAKDVVVYGDIQQANYINKYESNEGELEW